MTTTNTQPMSHAEVNRRVFAREPYEGVFWQPRVEPWFCLMRDTGRLAEPWSSMTPVELYRSLGISMRYAQYYTGLPSPLVIGFDSAVKSWSREEGGDLFVGIETPHGDLVRRLRPTLEGPRTIQFPVRSPDDLKKLVWLFQHTINAFDREAFDVAAREMGDLGIPQFWVPRSPYQALALDWMKYEEFAVALMTNPVAFEDVFTAIDESYDPLYEQLLAEPRIQMINFGENLDACFTSPSLFERYNIPFYEKRAGQLRARGIYTHVHLDGSMRLLLPFLRHLPFDGIEALTPAPMGDATLEEIRDALGDKVLLDGIPAVLFMAPYTRDDIQACVDKLIEYFHPRLVLGISDELPMGAEPEAMADVEWLRDYCRTRP